LGASGRRFPVPSPPPWAETLPEETDHFLPFRSRHL
jgi:hypothetical protein